MKIKRACNKRELILKIAVELSQDIGYQNLTRGAISKRVHKSEAIINYYFKDLFELKNEVVQIAIDKNIESILFQAFINRHPLIKKYNLNITHTVAKHLL